MTITAKDLFLSILAMDSYNRGYGAGISDSVDNDQNGLGLGVASARIGGATLGQDISTQAAKEAGFYAVTYTLGSETIISYRGTNFNAGAAIADIVNGWAIAAGDFRASQFTLSTQFLSAVEADTNGPITLTGHSLGGALAGLNSRLYGYEAVLFDNEPYLQATDYLRQFFLREEGLLDGILAAQPLQAIEQVRAAILGNYSGGEVSIADARAAAHAIYDLELSPYTEEQLAAGIFEFTNNARGYYMPGEALNIVLGNFNLVRDVDDYPWVSAVGLTDAQTNFSHTPGATANVDLHSMGALVIQMFSDMKDHSQTWLPIHEAFFQALFSEGVATSLKPFTNNALYLGGYKNGYLLQQIAYSALEGSDGLVFGNTAIRAMFNDANELGGLVGENRATDLVKDALPGLAEMLVQYAGMMALNKVDASKIQGIDPLKGILTLLANGTTGTPTNANSLLLDLSEKRWQIGATSISANPEIIGINKVIEAVMSDTGGFDSYNLFMDEFKYFYGKGLTGEREGLPSTTIERIEVTLNNEGVTYAMADPQSDPLGVGDGAGARHVWMYVGGEGADNITGNSIDNLLFGGSSADKLYGGGGKDMLVGGRDDDELYGGDGDDDLIGGGGADKIVGGSGFDRVSYADSNQGVEIDLSLEDQISGDAQGDKFENIEAVRGSIYDDILKGDRHFNVLEGGDGNDRLVTQAHGANIAASGVGFLKDENGYSIIAGGFDILDGGNGFDTYQINSNISYWHRFIGAGSLVLDDVNMPTNTIVMDSDGMGRIQWNGENLTEMAQLVPTRYN